MSKKLITPEDPEFWLEVQELDYKILEDLYLSFIELKKIKLALKLEPYLRSKNSNFRTVLN